MENYWNILEIDESADKAEIKKAYARMVRKYPPDKDPAMFKQICAAYDALCNDTQNQTACDSKNIPEQWKAKYHEVIELQKQDRLDEAIYLCDALLKVAPSEQFEVLLGRIYLDTNYSGKAVKIWEKITNTYPKNQDYLLELANAYEKRGWFKKALNICNQLKDQGIHSLPFYRLYIHLLPDNTKSDDIVRMEKDAELLLSDKEYPTEDDFICLLEMQRELFNKFHSVPNSILYHAKRILSFLKIQFLREKKSTWLLKSGISIFRLLGTHLSTTGTQEVFCSYSDWIHANSLSLSVELQFMVMTADELLFIEQLKQDGQVPDFCKKELPFFYKKNMFYELKRLLDIQGYTSDSLQMQYYIDEFEYHFSLTQEYDIFLYLLDYYKEFRSCLPHLKETYPFLAKGMAPYLDLVMESNQYQLKKEYEKKYRKLMEYPASAKLTLNEPVYVTDGTESYRRETPKIGRNDPCPCGSGKKYKKCCGKNES